MPSCSSCEKTSTTPQVSAIRPPAKRKMHDLVVRDGLAGRREAHVLTLVRPGDRVPADDLVAALRLKSSTSTWRSGKARCSIVMTCLSASGPVASTGSGMRISTSGSTTSSIVRETTSASPVIDRVVKASERRFALRLRRLSTRGSSCGAGQIRLSGDMLAEQVAGFEAMEPHIDVITLAVGDLDRALAFYRDGLGLETTRSDRHQVGQRRSAIAAGAVVMFRLRGGLVLALYPRASSRRTPTFPSRPQKTGESQHRTPRREQSRRRCAARPGRAGRRDPDRTTPRSPVGDLLRLLPRPRRTSLGDHLEPAARRRRAVTAHALLAAGFAG